jgi:hypothetical protein
MCPPSRHPPPRYEDADVYWQRLEDKYHFSCQFTADLIAMNHADFIVTSTYQVGAGNGGLARAVRYLLHSSWC